MKEKAFRLANKAINNPTLLDMIGEESYVLFVLGVARYYRDLAVKLNDIRPIINPTNKIKFWEAVGILISEQDIASHETNEHLEQS